MSTFNQPPTEPPWVREGAIESYRAGETPWEALSSPEQALVMDEVILVRAPLAALKERLRAQIEAEGGTFALCANCGTTYPLNTPDDDGGYWTDTTVCGPRCFNAYVAYLNNPDLGDW